jgi:hypothetical protein
MSFLAFEQSIASPDLRAIVAHWNNARGTRRMPSWSDLRSATIVKQLPIVWCYVYDAEEDDFLGRLGGEAIICISGKSIGGTKLSEFSPIIGYERLIARAKRVMRDPALVRGYGPMTMQLTRYGIGEGIIMPLGADGDTGDAILGATDCRLNGHVPSEAERTAEVEDWWSLGQEGAIEVVFPPPRTSTRNIAYCK